MKTSDFDYSLPPELIAQTPVEPRDNSRLMVLDRNSGATEHHRFSELAGFLRNGDVLVFNDSRVIPARLYGRKPDSGGQVELLLLRRRDGGDWEALAKPGKRLGTGTKVEITGDNNDADRHETGLMAEVTGLEPEGIKVLRFSDETLLPAAGEIPLPPYIHTPLTDPERYQAVYSAVTGSVAAPTAGLHFTPQLLDRITAKGARCLFVTLHVGLDTFRPVREEDPREHPIYREYGIISAEVAAQLSRARAEGRRIICVGTTTVRLVEEAARNGDDLKPFAGWVSLFILPGHRFHMVDALITNFHLPRSTLLMLATAFAGKDTITRAYNEAVARKYRFYSFGDAMLIT
ncbi:tRNA preQ1(34) S-adenosylmethionine ribosyltransferase-isomerase QueA [Chloroflexota bacterium]